MLCLSRREQESLIITVGDQTIEVQVLEIRGRLVRLGIQAEQVVRVARKELLEQKGGRSDE